MLSLLLALVMTLSLCVPALAADEFAAEAVTEVEEQAPEAPEAPVAPEAEEPADEPVVDEPAAEEPVEAVEDAPEMASIAPEELADEPLLVALGIVSKDAHWALYKAVQEAKELLPKVEAGELRQKNLDLATSLSGTAMSAYLADPEENDFFKDMTKDFDAAYESAVKYLDAVDGTPVDFNVTTSTVQAAADALIQYLPDEAPSPQNNILVDTAGNDASTQHFKQQRLKEFADYAYATYSTALGSAGIGNGQVSFSGFTTTVKVTENSDWKKAYHADYLTELQAALDTINSFNDKTATYKDFTTAANQILTVLQKEFDAARPAASDMSALDTAIANAETALKNYDQTKYARNLTSSELNTLLGNAYALKNGDLGLNGFDTDATYYKYNEAVTNLTNALVLKKTSIQYETHELKTNNTVDVTASVDAIKDVTGVSVGAAPTGDGNVYGYSYSVNGYWYVGASTAGTKDFASATIQHLSTSWTSGGDQYPNKMITTINLSDVDDTASPAGLKAGDVIEIRFHTQKANASTTTAADFDRFTVSSKTFTVSEAYAGPVITKVTYASGDGSSTLGYQKGDLIDPSSYSNSAFNAGSPTITVTLSAAPADAYDNYQLVMTGTKDVFKVTTGITTTTPTITGGGLTGEAYLVGGDMVVSLKIADSSIDPHTNAKPGDYLEKSSLSVKVDPLSKWTDVSVVKLVIADFQKLVKSDYKFDTSKRVDVKNLDDAFQTLSNDVAKLQNLITSATVANSGVNRQVVSDTIDHMIAVRRYFIPKTPDTTTIDSLIAQAKAIIDAGDDSWTFDSWGALKDAYDDAKGYAATDLQSDIDDLAADLQAAITGMTKEGEVDKTALNKAIADAKALVEADYTPESWATAKPAIDAAVEAAEAVAANENATQAQVTTATNAITAAMAGLEKVKPDEPEGPKAPTTNNGTGWVLYDGTWYFFKNSKLVSNYWVGKIDGASQWDSNWYYVGSDGKMLTGMQYIDDLHGGYGWYFLQPTNTKGEIGKMLTGYQWVGGQYGECYFSKVSGSSGKCTWSQLLGDWNGTTWVK